jgi:hypothetical protein
MWRWVQNNANYAMHVPVCTNIVFVMSITIQIYNASLYNYNLTEVEFGHPVDYHCLNGMKSVSDLSFTHQVATCNSGNIWTQPDVWEQCTDSK